MSYEGFEQYICKKGHFFSADCYDEKRKCPICRSSIVWCNSVDETNGEQMGYISPTDLKPFIVTPVVVLVCELCGHADEKYPALYRSPSSDETLKLRRWFDSSVWRRVWNDVEIKEEN